MDEDQEQVARAVQDLFRKDPLLLVGSGFSCSFGMPGMSELGEHLLAEVESRLSKEAVDLWRPAVDAIRTNLEDGLKKIPSGASCRDELVGIVREETARLIIRRTRQAEEQILTSASAAESGPARLLKRLYSGAPQNSGFVNVITTNYDTLIELFCDLAKIPVDTGFVGFRRRRPRSEPFFDTHYTRILTPRSKGVVAYDHKPCATIRLIKPHGSITWQTDSEGAIEVLNNEAEETRSIIIPGPSKYEEALVNQIFDRMRTEMTMAVNRASSLLCVGFGFNDDHLQGAIKDRLQQGMPALILTKNFTPNIIAALKAHPNLIAIQESSQGAECSFSGKLIQFSSPIWQVDTFLKEILE